MDKYLVIKNGLVLTLDRKNQTGYFNIIIKNNKIFLIDYENKFNEKEFKSNNPDAEIIDATNKLVTPGLFNSKIISSYTLNKFFFKKCSYENLNSWLSLKLIDKYLSNIENAQTLNNLLKISYSRSLRNGELFINESCYCVKKDFFDIYFTNCEWVKQYYNLVIDDSAILSDLRGQEKFLSLGFKTDEDINNYSLASIKKLLSWNKLKLFIEASFSQKTFESIKKIFGKPFVNVLAEMDLISSGTIISNPTHLNPGEIEILKKKNASILISPSDYINFSSKKIDLDDLFSSPNLIIGTGYTGNDILSELKILSSIILKRNLSYENLLKMATLNPSVFFGIGNINGSLERNKSADIILFSLDDIRNSITFPEIESESVCEFIIQNLSAKDISDIILRGEILIQNRIELFQYHESSKQKAEEISSKIYSAGKYHEYKEKYLMRGRVDKLTLDNTENEFKEGSTEEIFVDMTETGEYVGEGEFTILGAKEEEFEKPREKDRIEDRETVVNLKEISSLEDELNLFDDLEESQEILKPKISKNEMNAEKESMKQTDLKEVEQFNDEKELIANEQTLANAETKSAEEEELKTKAVFREKKLKFGFTDGE